MKSCFILDLKVNSEAKLVQEKLQKINFPTSTLTSYTLALDASCSLLFDYITFGISTGNE